MAKPTRDQSYLGIDSNVLLAYLMPDHPDHNLTQGLTRKAHAVNPTVLHETYHASVFKLKRRPDQTVRTLLDYMRFVLCLPVTAGTVNIGLKLALKHSLGGRDALILATYLLSKEVRIFVSMDKTLLAVGEVKLGKKVLRMYPPASIR